ncbi:MAG TPA: ferritin family protein [Clostridia bacterium]|nr:ferritin family protein [Clostridia bacterium]
MMNNELAILKEAIIAEMKAAEFYKLAAEKSDDPEVKTAFDELATEEELHMDWLKDIYEKLIEPGKMTEEFAFENFFKNNVKKDVAVLKFSEKALATATISVAVYGIAINMEKNAVEFYQNAADRTTQPRLRLLFNTLAEWEAGHAEQFREVYETMMDSWWDDQGFAPY